MSHIYSYSCDIQVLRKNGYNDRVSLILMLINVVNAHIFTMIITQYLCGPKYIAMFFNLKNYTLSVLAKLTLNMITAECCSMRAHQFLHASGSSDAPLCHKINSFCKFLFSPYRFFDRIWNF
jgi:hypothetical protein